MEPSTNKPASAGTQLKVHNIWAIVANIILIVITILGYVQPVVNRLANQQAQTTHVENIRDVNLSKQMTLLQQQLEEYSNQTQEVAALLDKTNVKGVATGSAIKKVK